MKEDDNGLHRDGDTPVPADFLEAPAAGLKVPEAPQPGWQAAEFAGTAIGPYKLLERLGEGSFGVVYLAEQRRPVKRRVALKIIKPGMDSREVIARFEAERQALALMDHPNVAQVYDAGATEKERPYFVMELVNGLPITEYCDTKKVPIRRRLELFMKVCAAVQHAHQKGIIHRDLKPSNILVAAQEGEAEPKVIDFGVAKAISRELTEKTLFTARGQLMGTPQYMSPEQARTGAGQDIDTRSDIYSLGVLLYELLTGKTPLDPERLRKAGYPEMERIIREEEPPRPSFRISTMGEELAEVAKQHGSEPDTLGKLVRGDLDWIVMKALEKDRARRYGTASEFAMDIARYLNDEPVEASPPSVTYRVVKFVRRNRGLVAAAAAVFVALAGGVVASSLQAREAERARDLADEERKRGDEERLRAERWFLGIDDAYRKATNMAADLVFPVWNKLEEARQAGVSDSPSSEMLEAIRDKQQQAIDDYYELASYGGDDDGLRMKSVNLNSKGDFFLQLGDLPAAKEYYERALEIRESLKSRHPEDGLFLRDLALSYDKLGDWHCHRAPDSGRRDDDYVEALEYYRKSLELNQKLADRPDAQSYDQHDVALGHLKIGTTLFEGDDKEGAMKELLELGLPDMEKVVASDPDNAERQAHLGLFCLHIGRIYATTVEDVKAREILTRGEDIFLGLRERGWLRREYEGWLEDIQDRLKDIEYSPPEKSPD